MESLNTGNQLARGSNYFHQYNWRAAGKEKRKFFEEEKLLIPRFVLKLQACYDKGSYILDNIYIINLINKKIDMKCLCAIFNSNLMNFYYVSRFSQTNIGGDYFAINGKQLKEIPIKIPDREQEKRIMELVNERIDLTRKINSTVGNEKERLQQQIKNIDYNINEEIYKLYNITSEEQKIIEESLG